MQYFKFKISHLLPSPINLPPNSPRASPGTRMSVDLVMKCGTWTRHTIITGRGKPELTENRKLDTRSPL